MFENTRKRINHPLYPLDLTDANIEVISVEMIELNEDNLFYSKDKNEIEDLAESLQELGQLSPILVNKLTNGNYKLIDGEKRYHAAKLANILTLKAIVQDPSDEEPSKNQAISTNSSTLIINKGESNNR